MPAYSVELSGLLHPVFPYSVVRNPGSDSDDISSLDFYGNNIAVPTGDAVGVYDALRGKFVKINSEFPGTFSPLIDDVDRQIFKVFLESSDKGLIHAFTSHGWLVQNGVVPELQLRNPLFGPSSMEVYVNLTDGGCPMVCRGCATDSSSHDSDRDVGPLPVRKFELMLGSVINQLRARAGENHKPDIKLKLAGGEPTTPEGIKKTEGLQPVIEHLRKRANIEQVVLTSGLNLNEEVVGFYKNHGIKVSLSMWGDGSGNVLNRGPLVQWKTLKEALVRLDQHGVSTSVNFIVTPFEDQNVGSLSNVLRALYDPSDGDYIYNDGRKSIPGLNIALWRPEIGDNLSDDDIKRMTDILLVGLSEYIRLGDKVPLIPGIGNLNLFGDFSRFNSCAVGGGTYMALAGNKSGGINVHSCHELIGSDELLVVDKLHKRHPLAAFDTDPLTIKAKEYTRWALRRNNYHSGSNGETAVTLRGGLGCIRRLTSYETENYTDYFEDGRNPNYGDEYFVYAKVFGLLLWAVMNRAMMEFSHTSRTPVP